MASRVDELQAKYLKAIKEECDQWSKDHPESYDDEKGERKFRKIPPTRGFVEQVVKATVNSDELAQAFTEDAMAAQIKPEPAKK